MGANDTDLHYMTATRLAAMVADRKVGCLELLDHFLARVERHNPALNAIIVLQADQARDRAREADAALSRGEAWGPLHGVPTTIKESFDVTGTPSTWGVPELRDNVASSDALAVRRLKRAGVTLFGKTNVPFMLSDWQSFNAIYGTTGNPWDTARTPGGSSGGSAAALAAGLTGLEAGSDIGASIRNPAHYCGLFGHKPTYGMLPLTGHALPSSPVPPDISAIGPLARGADDLETATVAMAGPDVPDSAGLSLRFPRDDRKAPGDFTVGVMLEASPCVQDTELTDQLQATIDRLARAGVRIRETPGPVRDPARAHLVYLMLLRAATGTRIPAAEIAEHRARAERSDPDDLSYRTIVDRAVTMSHQEWQTWNNERTLLCREWADFFETCDLLLTPVAASAAFPHDQSGDRADRTIPVNGTGQPTVDQLFWAGFPGVVYLPATAAPAGLTRSGLPCGLQIIGPYLSDLRTIAFARMMERELGGFVPPEGYG